MPITIEQGYALRSGFDRCANPSPAVEDVYRMVEAGVFEENDRVELVEGVLVDMVPIGAEHAAALAWLNRHFTRVDAEAWEVRVQEMLLVAVVGLGSPRSRDTNCR